MVLLLYITYGTVHAGPSIKVRCMFDRVSVHYLYTVGLSIILLLFYTSISVLLQGADNFLDFQD